MIKQLAIRRARREDIPAITRIYNQGIADRVATLEVDDKTEDDVTTWLLEERPTRYAVLVAESNGTIAGWAALRPYSHRCAYADVADLSVYVERDARGKGVGEQLLAALEESARSDDFHKIVLFTLPFNESGKRLYRKRGFREVGTLREQGSLDGRLVDVLIMEKILEPGNS
jgi:phosphinothricin acetyltransferase